MLCGFTAAVDPLERYKFTLQFELVLFVRFFVLRYCRDRVLENEEILAADIKQNREFIEALYPARQGRSLKEVNDHIYAFATGRIQKCILNVLGSWFFHNIFSFVYLNLQL